MRRLLSLRARDWPPHWAIAGSLALALSGIWASTAGAAAAAVDCGPVTLLVDRSGSMVDHDPRGAARLGFAETLDRAGVSRVGARAGGFTSALGELQPVDTTWAASTIAAMAGGDRGPTDLGATLALAREQVPTGSLIVLTDPEADGPLPALATGVRLVVATVDGPAPASLARAVRRVGGRVVDARARASELFGAVCGAREPAPAPVGAPPAERLPVVLIGGLRSRLAAVRGATTPAGCARAGAMREWCAALARAGGRVWVVPMAPGGDGSRMDSTGRLAGQASWLARWVRQEVPRGAVLIGHSMGGLAAHAASLQLDAGRVRALATVGTPHAGSFGADAYQAGVLAAAGCAVLCPAAVPALGTAAVAARWRFGAALPDLTRRARLGAGRLGAPRVPLAAYAGATSAPRLRFGAPSDGYLWPNDGIVGVGSATGALAGLHPMPLLPAGSARHSSSVGPRGTPTQLQSPQVTGFLVAQVPGWQAAARAARRAGVARGAGAGEVSAAAQGRATADRARSGRAPVSVASVKAAARAATRRVAELRPIAVGTPGVVVAPGQSVVATAPFTARCGELQLDAVPTPTGLWWLDPTLAGCSAPLTIDGAVQEGAGTPVVVPSGAVDGSVIAGQPAPPAATRGRLIARRASRGAGSRAGRGARGVRGLRRGVRVEVTGVAARPVVRCDGRRVAMRPRGVGSEWASGAGRWRGAVGSRGCRVLTATVRAADSAVAVAALLEV